MDRGQVQSVMVVVVVIVVYNVNKDDAMETIWVFHSNQKVREIH